MAKERLSKLQRWILTKCYEKGNDHHATPNYFCGRHFLVSHRIEDYLKLEKVKKYFSKLEEAWKKPISEKCRYNRFKYGFEVSATNSLRNLARKGYIKLLDKSRLPILLDSGYRQATIFVQLKDRGVKTVEKFLIINN
ncbi:hypothetical protein ES708_22451 [subsurface metagenome]